MFIFLKPLLWEKVIVREKKVASFGDNFISQIDLGNEKKKVIGLIEQSCITRDIFDKAF